MNNPTKVNTRSVNTKVFIVVWKNGMGRIFESLPFVSQEAAQKFADKEKQQAQSQRFTRYSMVSYFIKEEIRVEKPSLTVTAIS